MDKVIESFFALFSEFTWRRFLAFLIFVGLLFLGFLVYERYTASFQLSRLQKSAELIITIHNMEMSITNGSTAIQKAGHSLAEQSIQAVEAKPLSLDILPTTLRFSTDYLWKFLAGCAAWIALSISRMPRIVRGDKASKATATGFLFFGILAGLIGLAIPTFWWPWFHLVIYPLCILAFFYIVIFIPFMFWWCSALDKEKAKAKATDKS